MYKMNSLKWDFNCAIHRLKKLESSLDVRNFCFTSERHFADLWFRKQKETKLMNRGYRMFQGNDEDVEESLNEFGEIVTHYISFVQIVRRRELDGAMICDR